MTKKVLLAIVVSLTLFGCNDDEKKEKDLLRQIIEIHNKVMNDDEDVINNTAQLKSISANSQDAFVKDSVLYYVKSLTSADSVMMKWMGRFNPDFKGKNHEQIMGYLTIQEQEILKVDSQVSSSLDASNTFIAKVKGK